MTPMMKLYRSFAILAAVLLPASLAGQDLRDHASLELNRAQALWMSSTNPAGLAFHAPDAFNLVDISYSAEGGPYRTLQTGEKESNLRFDTQGALKIGKVQLWGRFRYDNITEDGSSFNTLLSNPYDDRFMYTAADTVEGKWKKQSYEMQFKAAVPIGDALSAGIHVCYTDRVAAGQIDPRAESYHYSVKVRPAFAIKAGSSKIGISGLYSNTFERSTPSISNSQETQKVFMLLGLGNFVGDQVGGSGLSTMYFRCDSWGAGLQYAYDNGWQLLAEAAWTRHGTRITESATQPKPHGDTSQDELEASIAAVFGSGTLHKAGLNFHGTRTTGTQHTVLWNTESGEWNIRHSLDQCLLSEASAVLSWDSWVRQEDSYSWHFRGDLGLDMAKDTYALPYSEFSYRNISAGLTAGRRFAFKRSSLLLETRMKGIKNLSATYSYSGHRSDAATVRVWYPHDIAVLGADALKAGLSAEYALPVGKGVSLAFCADGSYLFAAATLGPLHRWAAAGAIKLYF